MSSNLKYLYALCNYTIKIAFIVHMISGIWDISNIGTLGLVCEDQTNGILMLWNHDLCFELFMILLKNPDLSTV